MAFVYKIGNEKTFQTLHWFMQGSRKLSQHKHSLTVRLLIFFNTGDSLAEQKEKRSSAARRIWFVRQHVSLADRINICRSVRGNSHGR